MDTIIRESKHNKAPGLDNIPAESIRYADTVTKDEFECILKRIWSENALPSQWRQSLHVPIPKKLAP